MEPSPSTSVAAQDFQKRLAKVIVEHGVYDRVERGVDVAQPGYEVHCLCRDTTVRAEGQDDVHQEER